MKESKRRRLEKAGWRVGSAAEFLGLTPEESAFIEMKVALARELRARREQQSLTQTETAHRVGSSQSRIAKMESADESVSLDLLVRSLLALGAAPREIGHALGRGEPAEKG